MEKKDVIEFEGKKVKIILRNNYYYKGMILSVGEDYLKMRDLNDTLTLITLNEIKILEVLD